MHRATSARRCASSRIFLVRASTRSCSSSILAWSLSDRSRHAFIGFSSSRAPTMEASATRSRMGLAVSLGLPGMSRAEEQKSSRSTSLRSRVRQDKATIYGTCLPSTSSSIREATTLSRISPTTALRVASRSTLSCPRHLVKHCTLRSTRYWPTRLADSRMEASLIGSQNSTSLSKTLRALSLSNSTESGVTNTKDRKITNSSAKSSMSSKASRIKAVWLTSGDTASIPGSRSHSRSQPFTDGSRVVSASCVRFWAAGQLDNISSAFRSLSRSDHSS
mmetsp:Transcript_51690/g.113340  ORF Transcript_51690/g.113340 Transcript_51690/m.113340 type:complete len:277 (-) Transcript_51690:609-1439(-)